jgi:photosystem II stability/assembly factor-like uncharacterized protein
VTAAAALALVLAAAAPLPDRLDAPALRSPLAATSPLSAVAAAGGLAVAVGPRGHALFSADGGRTWAQASVPASADLTAVSLSPDGRGLAVGHDGLVLATEDGGRSWARRLDGRGLAALVRARHGCGADAAPEAVAVACAQGSALSLLDVWVGADGRGLAVGAFGLALRTEDGGRTFAPWLDRVLSPRALHLYAVRAAEGEVLVAGEQGLILRLDRARGRLVPVRSPPGGSLFGLVARGRDVVAFGLGGRALHSGDAGASFAPVATGVSDALVGGALLPGGGIVLVSRRGELVVSADGGRSFRRARGAGGPFAAAVAATPEGAILVAGAAGARRVELAAEAR